MATGTYTFGQGFDHFRRLSSVGLAATISSPNRLDTAQYAVRNGPIARSLDGFCARTVQRLRSDCPSLSSHLTIFFKIPLLTCWPTDPTIFEQSPASCCCPATARCADGDLTVSNFYKNSAVAREIWTPVLRLCGELTASEKWTATAR